MVAIHAKHLPYEDGHLGRVVTDMLKAGAPTIRSVQFAGNIIALEGSHRLAACAYLGLIPLLLIEQPDCAETSDFWARVLPELPRYQMTAYLIDARIGENK